MKVDWDESWLRWKSIEMKVDWDESRFLMIKVDWLIDYIVYPHSCGCGYIKKRCGYIGFGDIRCGYIKKRCGYIYTYPHLF